MPTTSTYAIAKRDNATFTMARTSEPFPGVIAFIRLQVARNGTATGWRLAPLVTMQGTASKHWPTAAEAVASTKLMSLAEARRAVDSANRSPLTGAP